jgi:hypothetical protein
MRSSTYIDSLNTLLLCQKHLSEQGPLFQDPTLDRSLVDGEDGFIIPLCEGTAEGGKFAERGSRYQDYFMSQSG